MKILNGLAAALLIIGGLNWGLVALGEFDLVAAVFGLDFGETNAATRVVYGLVGIAAVYAIGVLIASRGRVRDASHPDDERTRCSGTRNRCRGLGGYRKPAQGGDDRRHGGCCRPVHDSDQAPGQGGSREDVAAARPVHGVRTDRRCVQEGAHGDAERTPQGQGQAEGGAPLSRRRRQGHLGRRSVELSSAKTVGGKTIRIRVAGSNVFVNSSKVTKADVMASNGVIHIVNRVLIPPA